MQTRGFRAALSALFSLALSLDTLHAVPASFPPQGDDVTPSLGQMKILIAPNFQAMMSGNPNYNSSTHIFTSPLLYDPVTLIGRSGALLAGSAGDLSGVPTGSAGTMISQGNLIVQPGGLEPAGTREVHTEIRSLNLVDFGGSVAAVRAGTNAAGRPVSAGEVESWSGASGNSTQDFPAQSFFDVFVQVDIPTTGSFPGATNLYNDLPLLVQNTNVTSFPPQVIYVHGMTTAVPIKFNNNNPGVWTNGQIFGLLMLAGHDVVRTNDAAAQAAFQTALNATPFAPVEPQYASWGTGLTLANSNSMIFTNRGDDVMTSLGTFRLAVNPAFQAALTSASYPGWDSTTKRLTSPLLFDQSTTIGRSSPLTNGSPADLAGVLVGSAGTLVASSNLTLVPALFEGPAGTREVHTEIRSLNLASGGTAVRAGTAATSVPKSLGEVESLSGNSGDPYWDFPAKSFFDIFVDVDVPASGAFPTFTLSNAVPLVVQNNNLTVFPPKVLYVHGNTTAVPVLFTTNVSALGASAGDTFGIILLAGHGAGFNPNNTNDVAQFNQQMTQLTEQPVAPQYVTWAPNLKTNPPTSAPITLTCSSNLTVTASAGYGGAYVNYSSSATGGCSPPVITYNPPSGSFFNVGTTIVSCTATDTCGDTASCSFQVTVNPPPTLICPTNITITTGTTNGAVVNFTAGLTGGCPPITFTGYPYNSGAVFPLGITYETVYVYDCSGYEGYCSFTVTVTDTNLPPLTVTCPSNITVTASSSSGAVVNFTVDTSGGCPPIYVSTSPYSSGSTFPIGTTTENVYVYDSCVGSYVYYCSFNVTVNLPTSASVNEYFSSQAVLPPPNSVYISPALWHLLFNNGIVIRDVRHRFFTQSYPLPPLGSTTTETFSSEVDYQISMDNGATFNPGTGTANLTVQVTHGLDNNGVSFFNTEMLQLDLAGTGFILRESPTLQSTGQTTVRPVPGGYMISSFFDIFTELSTDNGISWTPANGPGHVEMRPDPKLVTPAPEPTPLLPPPNDHYVSPQQWHALYAQGIVIKNVSHRLFTGSLPPPAPGVTNVHYFNSTLNLQFSIDGGNTFQFASVTAPVQVTVANASSSSDNALYDTEMTSLNVTLPGGLLIRESPTLPSRGATEMTAQSDGTYKISSFFDVFTELSLDGGATWSPATNGPVRMQLTQQAPEVPTPNNNLPVTTTPYVSPQQWHALYANGIILTNVSHSRFTQTQPPPPPGGNQTESFGSQVSGLISMDGGASFQPFQAPANVAVQVNSRSDLDTGSTRFFDTEMLSLNLSGGNLPGGIMVRESPTRQSLGRTSVRTSGMGYQISSFFDVFTEISLDNGQTWTPSVTGPGTMSPGATNNGTTSVSINCPSNITVTATSSNGATVFYTVTASGGCPPLNIVANPPSGSTFPIGTTTVFSTASDTCGNSAQCSFTVTVVAPPINLNCPSNITVQATGPSGAVVYFTATATGGCSPPPFVNANPPSGSTFPIGTTTVYTYASDNCGTSTNCSFTVTVNPPVYPPLVISCPSNIVVTVTNSSSAIVYYYVGASGGCSPPPNVYSYPPSGSSFPVGTTTVNSTANDTCGNYTNCSFTVTVISTNNNCIVSIYCPSNLVVTSSVPTTVYFNVNASDSCGGFPSIIANPPSGSTFPIGTTTVFNTAYDANGTNSCSFTVTVVQPVVPPINLNCGSNVTVTASSSSGATVFFNLTASGGCSPPPMIVANPPSGSTFPVGTTTVLVTASDNCGGSTNCSFLVTVVKSPIVLNCSSNITVTATSSNGATVFFNLTASGGCSPPPMIVANPPSGSTFPVGTTTVNVTASDNCGTSTNCSFTVHVNPPVSAIVLNCSSNLVVTTSEDNGGAYVFFDVTATGGCGPLTINSSPASGDFFPPGTTTGYTVASDACGNSNSCSFTVTVVDPAIVLTCSSNLVVTANMPGGAYVFFNVTAIGGCDGSPTVESYPPTGSFFPLGTTIVSSTASDTCSSSTNCSFTVTVNPPGPIALTCSSNITTTATSASGATVFYSVTASGGCSTPTVSAYPPSGSTFPVGATTVSVTASDACGDSTNCSFVVNVVASPINVNCSSNLTTTATGPSGATVFYSVIASGGCSTPTISAYPPSGSTFPVGATTVSVTASDGCGDSTNCSFVVNVVPSAIVLNCPSNITTRATSAGGATVFYSVTASGGCSTPTVSAYPPSGSTFPVGSTTVSVIASDTCGNSANCSFVVTVARPPIVLNCSSNFTRSATSPNGATVFYTVTASGGCSTPIVSAYPPSGSTFPIGVTTVFTTASDGCDTSTNCSFTVTVTGTNSPASGPRLSIRLTGPNHLLLAWPTNTTFTYSIAQTLSLGGTNWLTLSNLSSVVGGSNQVTLALSNTQSFFRLTSPATNTSPCLVSLTLTNCDLPESVFLAAPATNPTVNPGSPVNVSATLNLTPGLVAVVSYYTNSTGYSPNCPDTFVTNLVSPTIISNYWIVQGPGSYTASGPGLNAVFTPAGCGSGTIHFITTWQHVCDAGQSSAFVSGSFTVNCANTCLVAGVSTNCAIAGSMALTNTTAGTNFCFGNAVSASVTNLITTNSQIIVTTTYTNAAGAVTTNCPPTFVTNSVAPTVVSNWWTVSGPGSYTNSGAGLTATFTPTNGGSGTVRFYLKYANNLPCNTNPVTVSTNIGFNVIQITNLCVATVPTNRTRTTVGVAEEVNLALAGSPAGTYTWSTTAGSVNPTTGIATLFSAPSNAVNATVTVTYPGGSCPIAFTVIPPNGYYASNVTAIIGYGVNRSGAGMRVPLWLTPSNVSFYKVEVREVPATSNLNTTGYFLNTNVWPNGFPMHDTNHGAGGWVPISGFGNRIGTDTARGGFPTPWSNGSVTWPIPGAWKVIGATVTNSLNWSDQVFSIQADGTATVNKFGHTVTRNTNDVYTTVN